MQAWKWNQIDGTRPSHLSDAVSLAAYRIVQESLTKALRHAADAAVRVNLCFDATRISIAVKNGTGARACSSPMIKPRSATDSRR